MTLLRREAGIEIAQSGGPGTNASLFMRGAGSNQTLVLIDGVRVASGTSGGAQIAQLMADQIDHIEVVRGNVSALYGSDAIGGVVQIFTRNGRGHGPLANAEIEYGARNTKRAQAGISGSLGENGDTSFAVSVSEFKTNGFSTINPQQAPKANPNDNPYTNKSVSAQLSHRFSADWQAGLTYFQTWGDVSYDNAFGKPTDDNVAHNVVRSMSAYVDGKVTQDWKTRLTLSQGDDRSLNYTNGVLQVPARFNTRNQTASWQNDWAFMPDQLLKVGLEHLQTSIDSDAYNVPTRNVDSGYIGYEGKFGPHQLQLNLRRDRYSDFGGANSYYAGYGFAFNPQWKAVASVSNAFRAPSFNELYYPFFGNPNVQPEKALGGRRRGIQRRDRPGARDGVRDGLQQPDHGGMRCRFQLLGSQRQPRTRERAGDVVSGFDLWRGSACELYHAEPAGPVGQPVALAPRTALRQRLGVQDVRAVLGGRGVECSGRPPGFDQDARWLWPAEPGRPLPDHA